jgi:DNA-binding transcriptional LysR family regulator
VLGGGWEALQTGQAQIAVGVSGDLPKGQYHVVPLGQAEFVFAISPAHPLATETGIISAEQLKEQTLIIVADSAISTPRQSSGLLDTRHSIRVMNMTAKIEAQKCGTGIGFLPRHLIQRELASGELIIKPIGIPRANASLYLAWDKQLNGNALQWFSTQLSQLDWPAILSV